MAEQPLLFDEFYAQFNGHSSELLQVLIQKILQDNPERIIWLAGDSSLDNKFWIQEKKVPATNGYERYLSPGLAIPDVCHHLNSLLSLSSLPFKAINTAVEASTLEDRLPTSGWPQDDLIANSLRPQDILLISIGGNDIALNPSPETKLNMKKLLQNPTKLIEDAKTAEGMSHFVSVFKTQVESYIKNLTHKQKPSVVVVCMIYFPDEKPNQGWADGVLSQMGYNERPEILQTAIKAVYEEATRLIEIEGVQVVPFGLFEVLDGKQSEDYVSRVEPSDEGGRKMAKALLSVISKSLGLSVNFNQEKS